jgi:hypothetical protein
MLEHTGQTDSVPCQSNITKVLVDMEVVCLSLHTFFVAEEEKVNAEEK